ncbi:MAG: SUMF1/EgtB/PvdO family nonheme iron enzyme, partial [Myxococcales bacterium]|nr:SUMF1/EgtB/PvdO family nonheme iron enzyme [Myxococcales bacterium]
MGLRRPPPREPQVATSATPGPRYEIRDFIGAGAMGDVWRVYDFSMDRTLAMKVLAASLANDEQSRRRFDDEVRIIARLQHPGVVPVHDRGTLADGRPYFTMTEVRGHTLHGEIARLHRGDDRDSLERERRLRRVVEALVRCCEAVAHAHRLGVVHRDLKPSNVMLGALGEALVMDWGLATDARSSKTVAGPPVGTLAYMAPERLEPPGTATYQSDVYSLGATLYEVLAGTAPYAEHRWVRAALAAGPPAPLVPDGWRPGALCALAEQAMDRSVERRPSDARWLAGALRDWLDDVERHDRAHALVARADLLWEGDGDEPGIVDLRERMEELRTEAASLLAEVLPSAPVSEKITAWDLEAQAEELAHRVAVLEVEWQQTLRSALNEVPDLATAHDRLADHYREAHAAAEQARDRVAAKGAETLLAAHDRGRHAAYLRGDAQLTLRTDPPGAMVVARPFRREARRLVTGEAVVLGRAPLVELPITAGSYLLEVEAPGHHRLRFPVVLERGAHWDPKRPGDDGPPLVALAASGTLAEDDLLVPGGFCVVGGDPHAVEALPRTRLWVDSFVIKRSPVTCGEYLDYLNALVAAGREEEAVLRAPKLTPGSGGELWPRDGEGRYGLPSSSQTARHPRWPVTLVDWHDACAYAVWLGARTGQPWRLPSELEWEKAA